MLGCSKLPNRSQLLVGRSSPYCGACGGHIAILWPPCIAGCGHIYFHPVVSSFFFFISSPNLSGRTLDVYHTSHTWCGLSANLERMSEVCCTWLSENTGRKNDAKTRHLVNKFFSDCRYVPQLRGFIRESCAMGCR